MSYENDYESDEIDEIDDNLINLIIQTNTKLKEFGYKSLIINCSSNVIRIGRDSGGAIEVNLNNQSERISTATSIFMAQGGRGKRNTGSKLTNVGKFTTHKGK